MQYADAVAFLDDHIGLGVQHGLERMVSILDLLDDPQKSYPIVHITGTNGKTSTARVATMVLAGHGLVAGTFTSPHLQAVEERLALNGEAATPERFAQAITDLKPFVDLHLARSGEPPTYFELTALAAFSWMATEAVDVGVFEVGLGGRLDATNAGDGQVAVVTGIARDHVGFLGSDLAGIAKEKLAIAKAGSVLVTGPLPTEADREAELHAQRLGISRFAFGRDFSIDEATPAVGGWMCDISGVYGTYPEIYLPLHGSHQVTNLAVALAAVEGLMGRELSPDGVIEGAASATSPGRLEVVGHYPLIILDGAHNPSGVSAMSDALVEEFPPGEWTVVLGVMADKKIEEMLEAIELDATKVFACAVNEDRALEPAAVATAARLRWPDAQVVTSTSVGEATADAITSAGATGSVLIFGSLYVVGEARTSMGI